MYFSRAKTFLIILFIFVNIFLISIIYSDSREKYISDTAVEQTVSVLQKRNIYIDKDLINRKNDSMFYLNLINPMSEESEKKKNIKGKIEYKEDIYTFIPENGKYEFKNLLPGSQTAEEILLILKEHGISSKYFVWDGSLDMGSGIYRATFNQIYDSVPLYSSKLNVFFTKNGIIRTEGLYFNIDSVSSIEENIISPLEILLRLSEYGFEEKTTVNSISRGYYTESVYSSYSTLPAIPCYRVTLINGNEFFFDATNGNIIELSKF